VEIEAGGFSRFPVALLPVYAGMRRNRRLTPGVTYRLAKFYFQTQAQQTNRTRYMLSTTCGRSNYRIVNFQQRLRAQIALNIRGFSLDMSVGNNPRGRLKSI
jgi:hypothetical protein